MLANTQAQAFLRSRLPVTLALLGLLAVLLTVSWRYQQPVPGLSVGSNKSGALQDHIQSHSDHAAGSSSPITVTRQAKLDEVLNSTLGFEKVFALSLPERTDRRDGLVLTSAITGFEIDFIDGIRADAVPDRVLPPDLGNHELKGNSKGAWRAHMNVLRQIVQQGYGSALIFEEDVDWDHRLKQQLQEFATASSGVLSRFTGDSLPHFGQFRGDTIEYTDLSQLKSSPDPVLASDSPYGQGWDVLWLGNCLIHNMDARTDQEFPLSVVKRDDPTTLPVEQYWALDWEGGTAYRPYDNHTRVYVSQPSEQTCTYAYAVSQKGARKILLELGLEIADRPYDTMLDNFCKGGWRGGLTDPHVCWGVMPTIFSTYVPAGRGDKTSDINDDDAEAYRAQGFSLNLEQSVRINARKILAGKWNEIEDAYPFTPGT